MTSDKLQRLIKYLEKRRNVILLNNELEASQNNLREELAEINALINDIYSLRVEDPKPKRPESDWLKVWEASWRDEWDEMKQLRPDLWE